MRLEQQKHPMLFWSGGVIVWAIFLIWMAWMYHSQKVYARDFAKIIAKGGSVPVYTPGDVVTFKDNRKIVFVGWSQPESKFRWTSNKKSSLIFRLAPGWNRVPAYRLKVHFQSSIGLQHVTVLLNHQTVSTLKVQGPGTLDAQVPAAWLADSDDIDFLLPDARAPGIADPRVLSVAFVDFDLEPVTPRAGS